MMYRRPTLAAAAASQSAGLTPVRPLSDPDPVTHGPSDTETMVSRFFPLGRLRLAAANAGGSDRSEDERSRPTADAPMPARAPGQIESFPDGAPARACRLTPAGQSRGAVLLGTRGKAIPARRVWGIPDIS